MFEKIIVLIKEQEDNLLPQDVQHMLDHLKNKN